MNKQRIVPLSVERLPQIMAIEREAFGEDAWSQQSFVQGMQQPTARYLMVCAEENVLGYMGFLHVLDEMELLTVATAKTARRQGIGARMMRYLLDYARENDVARILLEVRISNATAVALYERMGFRRIGVRKAYYSKPKEDALLYEWTRSDEDASESSV